MARSEIAEALNRLESFAENWVMLETQRRVQESRNKEARIAEAYKYLISKEDEQIAGYEMQLDSIQTGLENKGVQLQNLGDQHKTVEAEVLLQAANESPINMLNIMLKDTQEQAASYQDRLRSAKTTERQINLLDAAMSDIDPAATGEENIVDAGDVRVVAGKFLDESEKHLPEVLQRIEALQQPGSLAGLQEDYYTRLMKEVQTKTASTTAENIDSNLKIQALEGPKTQALEAVTAKLQENDSIGKLVGQYGNLISYQMELDEIENIESKDYIEKQGQIQGELSRLGTILYPWSDSEERAQILASNMRAAIVKAGQGNYHDLIQYLKEGNMHYKEMSPEMADLYQDDILSTFGIDISNDAWIDQLDTFNGLAGRIDIEQAVESMKISNSLLPDIQSTETSGGEDLLLQQFLEGSIND